MNIIRFNRQNGDTIVEVLIVIAIISLVLGGAFASSRSSLVATQQSHERGEAVKFLEQQLELLKAAAEGNDTHIFDPSLTTPFCLDLTLTVVTPGCRFGDNERYTVTLQRLDPATRTFRGTATWEKAGGGTDDSMNIYYKVYPRRDL